MAVTSTDVSARLRLTDMYNNTLMTVSSVDTAVAAEDLSKFTLAVSALRNNPINGIYLVVESELAEDGEAETA